MPRHGLSLRPSNPNAMNTAASATDRIRESFYHYRRAQDVSKFRF